jgi:hypothetical protein
MTVAGGASIEKAAANMAASPTPFTGVDLVSPQSNFRA